MKRSERLKNIMTLAEKKENDAATALGVLKNKIESELQKKSQLNEFEVEYHQKITDAGRQGVKGSDLRRYYGFMSHLNSAAEQQEKHISELEKQVGQVQAYWLKTRGELKAFESLVDKAKQEEKLVADKQEQKVFDELSGMMHFRNKTS
ncbi:flagellar export protein FliJ [Oceanospirillum sediminis]|uniref:Flagellar FliJ protein n=1 Tax=Oceanospirillum sediminis TaxID=2760088 RepID=A0A839IL31_9GAMM|nr:flagellar export protein FliJ [Oceanospirillum sediminis]MBB1485658.1 flagellar export protein FliJ [Oceanospirillum sediminis]